MVCPIQQMHDFAESEEATQLIDDLMGNDEEKANAAFMTLLKMTGDAWAINRRILDIRMKSTSHTEEQLSTLDEQHQALEEAGDALERAHGSLRDIARDLSAELELKMNGTVLMTVNEYSDWLNNEWNASTTICD